MAIEPCQPEDCDGCAERPCPYQQMCADCWAVIARGFAVQTELTYGTDPKGRRWLDEIPENPSRN